MGHAYVITKQTTILNADKNAFDRSTGKSDCSPLVKYYSRSKVFVNFQSKLIIVQEKRVEWFNCPTISITPNGHGEALE